MEKANELEICSLKRGRTKTYCLNSSALNRFPPPLFNYFTGTKVQGQWFSTL